MQNSLTSFLRTLGRVAAWLSGPTPDVVYLSNPFGEPYIAAVAPTDLEGGLR